MDLKRLILLACWPYSGGTSSSRTFILISLTLSRPNEHNQKKGEKKEWRTCGYLICNLHAVVSSSGHAFLKDPVQPSAELDSEQTVSELIVSSDKTLYRRVAGLLSRT